ncbi:hypothetical protein B0H14DRAFT_2572764 [Mycena olivaceomarginata]|nr:hypothetical protein B0H14DRAFT_2572764 [Mycena olivaceomarginata]
MSPSMPIIINVAAANASQSVASSPSSPSASTSSSSSSSGRYIPVHKRTASASPPTPQRTLPIYTPTELLQLAASPFVKQAAASVRAVLHHSGSDDDSAEEEDAFAAIALSRRRPARAGTVVVTPAPAAPTTTRRRPVGRAAERNPASRASRFSNKFMDAASWRGQGAPRHSMGMGIGMEAQRAVALAV